MIWDAASKVTGVGRATLFIGHLTRAIQPSRALVAALAAILAAVLLMLAMSPPSNAAKQKPDLTIAKIGPSQLFVGEADFYHIVITNKGPGPVTIPSGTVLIRDTLTGATFNAAGSGPGPYNASFSNGLTTVTFATTADDTIGVGKTRNFSVDPRSPSATGTITNTAQLDPDGAIAEAKEDNNSSMVTTTVVERPESDLTVNLALAISDHPDPATVRKPLTYILKVTNNGPDTLPPGAFISDNLPASVKFRSVEFVKGLGECVLIRFTDRQPLMCRVSNAIGVGEAVKTKIVVVPKRKGRLESSAYAQGGGQLVSGDPVVVHPGGYPTDTEKTRVLRPK